MILKRNGIVAAVLIILVGAAFYQHASAKKSTTDGEVYSQPGFQAPSFTLQAFNGKTYAYPPKDGKPVLINFWASWCGDCYKEAPDLTRLFQKYKDQIDLLSVDVAFNDNRMDAKHFAQKFGFPFPVLRDTDRTGGVTALYQVDPLPTSFFVDRNGTVVGKLTGLNDKRTIEQMIRKMIKQ